MELFDPERHAPARPPLDFRGHAGLSRAEPPLPLHRAAHSWRTTLLIPRPEDCYALWDRYAMLDNIRAHSAKVAEMAHALALRAKERGMAVIPEAALAAGLLHDLGKTYTISHGGNHAQIGASWVMNETRNDPIARAVMFHVHWPWEERPDNDDFFLVMAIVYADKRVKHDAWATLNERFEDLLARYGVNAHVRERVTLSHRQGKRMEAALSRRLGVDLDACVVDSGRLVQRT